MSRIPDISYHLVFCFLSLNDLTQIGQCNKECKRLVTAPSFLNMFSHGKSIDFNCEDVRLASNNPFRHLIREIVLLILSAETCSFNAINYLVQFDRLASLEFWIDWDQYENNDFDITPVFRELGHRLCELKVRIFRHDDTEPTNSFSHYFEKSLLLLTSLKSLALFTDATDMITDFSFLSQMKKLQSFSSNCKCNEKTKYIIHFLSSLPELNSLDLCYFFNRDNLLTQLKELCPAFNLKHLGIFHHIPQEQEYECAQNLHKLNHLENIEIDLYHADSIIPNLFGKWIHSLGMRHRVFTDHDVLSIVGLPHLKSLELKSCQIDVSKLSTLIVGLSSRLEILAINGYQNSNLIFEISFKDLSSCYRLKSLSIDNKSGLKVHELEYLLNCKHLETIKLTSCNIKPENISLIMEQALKIPSNVFPKLKNAHIS
jgi:hypothetical protein